MHSNFVNRLTGSLAIVSLFCAGCFSPEIKPAQDASFEVISASAVTADGSTKPGDWTVLRVSGDGQLEKTTGVTKTGESATFYRSGSATLSAALPDNYAPPTPPGAIELKKYPTVREAVISSDGGRGAAFYPLFEHIQSRKIAMTAPVVMTGRMAGERDAETTMSFLYRNPDLGPTGAAERNITVRDTEPMYVVAVGFQGTRNEAKLEAMRAELFKWLDGQGNGPRWTPAGDTRLLGYNGPDKPSNQSWWEVQIPVVWKDAP